MLKRLIASLVCFTFISTSVQPVFGATPTGAQNFNVNQLPAPGTMVTPSTPFVPLALKGLVVNVHKPLEFQFIVDTGSGHPERSEGSKSTLRSFGLRPQDDQALKQEAQRLVKYFLAGLTIPEGDLWVNLSPYEKNRMVPHALGQTDLGRDMLAQDYMLKQLTASLIYPEKDLGKEFWNRVYQKAQQQFGTTSIPVNTFNKVWILPDQAQVFEHGAAAYVTKATLKVMLDEDYLALSRHPEGAKRPKDLNVPLDSSSRQGGTQNDTHSLASQIVRDLILPEIEKEINTGANFAPIRQIYQALILAKWYKETIQNGLLDAVYTDKNKTSGVNLADPAVKQQIYNRYLQAYKKGVFNYIKEEPGVIASPKGEAISTGTTIPRKYFSGGAVFGTYVLHKDGAMAAVKPDGAMLTLDVALQGVSPAQNPDAAMVTPNQLLERQIQIPARAFVELVYQQQEAAGSGIVETQGEYLRAVPENRTIIVMINGLEKTFFVDNNTQGPQILGIEAPYVKWQRELGSEVMTSTVTPAGIVIGTADGKVSLLDPQTGKVKWKRALGGSVARTSTVTPAGIVIGGRDGMVKLLDIQTGQEKWHRELGSVVMTSIVTPTGIVIGTGDSWLRLLDIQTGGDGSGWMHWLGSEPQAIAVTPAGIVIGTAYGRVSLLDHQTGQVQWQWESHSVVRTIAVTSAGIVIGTADGRVKIFPKGKDAAMMAKPAQNPDAAMTAKPGQNPDQAMTTVVDPRSSNFFRFFENSAEPERFYLKIGATASRKFKIERVGEGWTISNLGPSNLGPKKYWEVASIRPRKQNKSFFMFKDEYGGTLIRIVRPKNPNVELIFDPPEHEGDKVVAMQVINGTDAEVSVISDAAMTARITAGHRWPVLSESQAELIMGKMSSRSPVFARYGNTLRAFLTGRISNLEVVPIGQNTLSDLWLEVAQITATAPPDAAMTANQDRATLAQPLGGIDLNQINVLRKGKTVLVHFDPAQLNELLQGGFEGFVPIIINITPIQSPLPLLGINQTKDW